MAEKDHRHGREEDPAWGQALRSLLLARNGSGLRELARSEGVGVDEVRAFVRRVVAEETAGGSQDRMGARFDIHTSQYKTLAEWADDLLASL